MAAQITVRIPDDLQRDLERLSSALRLKRSDVVRLAIRKMADEMGSKVAGTPYERVRDLVGSVDSGVADLGSAHREHLLRILGKDA